MALTKKTKTIKTPKNERAFMQFISCQTPISDLKEWIIGQSASVFGCIHRLRVLNANLAFIILRLNRFLVQIVVESPCLLPDIKEGDYISVIGTVKSTKLKDIALYPSDAELVATEITVINKLDTIIPFDMSKKDLNIKLDLELDMRPISMRHPKRRAVFKIQAAIVSAFEAFLESQGFTRIFSPKIVLAGAEGGANVFKINYFDKIAYLAQSPQFYKQFGVGVFGKVYDVGTVFRAEKHNTTRHINEYISLDFEMHLDSFVEIMVIETAFLSYLFAFLKDRCAYELELLALKLPEFSQIPVIKLSEAHAVVLQQTGKDYTQEPDLAPEEERLLTEWSFKEHASEFLFVTHFPSIKRPFYAKDDPLCPSETLSFDLLFRGVEITTGGQRIHNYQEQVEKMERTGLNPKDFESFLQFHKYGAPPHGGLGLGLERLTACICGFDNVKMATSYPRDLNRLSP